MKTKTFLLLCFIAAFAVNNVKAQNSVIKYDGTADICGDGVFLPCTGDYLCGTITYHEMNMHNRWIVKIKDVTIEGFKDEEGLVPSGNSYEVTQVANGEQGSTDQWHNHLSCRVNGKLIAEVTFTLRVNINANGDVTAVVDNFVVNCKK